MDYNLAVRIPAMKNRNIGYEIEKKCLRKNMCLDICAAAPKVYEKKTTAYYSHDDVFGAAATRVRRLSTFNPRARVHIIIA